MNKSKLGLLFVLAVVLAGLLAISASAEDVNSIKVYADGVEVYSEAGAWYENDNGTSSDPTDDFYEWVFYFGDLDNLDLQRGEDLDLEIVFETGVEDDVTTYNGLPVIGSQNIGMDTSNLVDWYVEAEIKGYRDSIYDKTDRFDVTADHTYKRSLTLSIPRDLDATEDYSLYVSISAQTELTGSDDALVDIQVSKKSYIMEDLFVEIGSVNGCCLTAQNPSGQGPCDTCWEALKAGSKIEIAYIVGNEGSHDLEDVYVTARIPELCIERTVYVGDLADEDNDDDEDTLSGILYLQVPVDAKAGTYTLEVTAWNDDADATSVQAITIAAAEKAEQKDVTQIVVDGTSKEVTAGGNAEYTFTIMNVGANAHTYTVEVEGVNAWATSEVAPSVLRLAGDASGAVTVTVTPKEDAVAGDHIFTVSVKADGETIKQYNVVSKIAEKEATGVDTKLALLVAAIVLAVVIVILLIIMIAKIASKGSDEKAEETAYY